MNITPGKYLTRDGKVATVLAVGLKSRYPVIGYTTKGGVDMPLNWTAEGFCCLDKTPFTDDLVAPHNEFADLPVDTLVWVHSKYPDEWLPRRFARLDEDGRPLCWPAGTTSLTADSEEDVTRWGRVALKRPY